MSHLSNFFIFYLIFSLNTTQAESFNGIDFDSKHWKCVVETSNLKISQPPTFKLEPAANIGEILTVQTTSSKSNPNKIKAPNKGFYPNFRDLVNDTPMNVGQWYYWNYAPYSRNIESEKRLSCSSKKNPICTVWSAPYGGEGGKPFGRRYEISQIPQSKNILLKFGETSDKEGKNSFANIHFIFNCGPI